MADPKILQQRYRIAALLGQGGMGRVYRGTDLETQTPVAVKVLQQEFGSVDPESLQRFEREMEILRTLDHPNIVKVLATGQEDGEHFLVMEYIQGGTLLDLLEKQASLELSKVLEIALDLVDALTRAHRLDIIHRDIKPGNVLLAADGTARLSDFGLAKMGGITITRAGNLVGTLAYMSPEQCAGKPADARSDIWALGVLLFEILTGMLPFDGEDPMAAVVAITTQAIPSLERLRENVPVDLVDLVYRMLEKEPADRIPSMRQVGVELEAITSGLIISGDKREVPLPRIESRFAGSTPYPLGTAPHNLPPPSTPFIGREFELTQLTELLNEPSNRLITILGPGGMGKTRLGIETARGQLANFVDGVIFVPLAPLTSVESVIPAVAEAAGFHLVENQGLEGQVFEFFRQRQSLLVLDNLEHMLEVADLIVNLLQVAPRTKVIATSREKLNLQDEIRFSIEGMDLPLGDQPISKVEAFRYSAIKLFMQAAKKARPGYVLAAEDMSSIIKICQMVGGAPLGILLAASWIEMFSPQDIAAEISSNLDFLETQMGDMPARHRSMRAVYDSSWNQLTESGRAIFMKLAVFRGGFRREAAAMVAEASLGDMIGLVNKSLVHRDPQSGRYEVHELLRQYGEAQLESREMLVSAQTAHSRYYLGYVSARLRGMLGPDQVKTLDEIEAEFRNIQSAWRWGVQQKDYAAVDQAAESLFKFSDMRSREHEGVNLFESARDEWAPQKGEPPHPTWARLLLPWFDLKLQSQGRSPEDNDVRALAERCLKDAQEREDDLGIAYNLILLGHFVEPREALKNYHQALELVPRLDDSFWLRIRTGFCYRILGDITKALDAFWQSFHRGHELGEEERQGWSLYNIGETEINLGDLDSALSHMQSAKDHFSRVGTIWGTIWANVQLSFINLVLGNLDLARSRVDEAHAMAIRTNRLSTIGREAQAIYGYLALINADYELAREYFEANLTELATSPESSLGLAFVNDGLGDYPTARGHLRDALKPLSNYRSQVMQFACIPAAALILASEGETEKARELLTIAFFHPSSPYELLQRWPQITNLRTELISGDSPEAAALARDLVGNVSIWTVMASLQDLFDAGEPEDQELASTGLAPAMSTLDTLSKREMDVLRLLKTELSGPEIAQELSVSLNTMRFHTKNIYSKLQVNNRRAAVRRAQELDL